ncbi:hypothetical protein [Actinomadura sp. HBU206391]|uniref:hypothetical protein n=1 Tax=Actinomadura sp. HBU206391 TaxID=2731692 RepID=UPI0016508446|nr:hypothetical protein [Actinomadura sp. HBU206391]MBC6461952.1 hypothetical protein [Actinomadura sp. HBU206391]
MYPPPPRIDPRELRPGRHWFVVAGLLALVFIALGVGGFAWGLTSSIKNLEINRQFQANETVTVQMTPESSIGVYVTLSVSGDPLDGKCTVTSPSGQSVPVTTPSGTFTVNTGDQSWQEIHVVQATEAGAHRLTCQSGIGPYATGRHPDTEAFGGLIGGVAALLVLPLVGVVTGAIIATVTGVKRGGHRRRLLAERYGRL